MTDEDLARRVVELSKTNATMRDGLVALVRLANGETPPEGTILMLFSLGAKIARELDVSSDEIHQILDLAIGVAVAAEGSPS